MADDDKKDDTNDTPEAKSETKAADTSGDKASDKASDKPGGGIAGKLLFAVLFVGTLVGGYALGQKIQEWRRGPVEVEDETRYKVSLRGDEPQKGPDDALVTIIEFSDFQCPYCAKAAGPLSQAAASWGDDVRVIYKHYPLPGHINALPAAKVAWAAHQQDKFWEFHDWLFESGGKIDELPSMVEKYGLDGDKLGEDMESDAASTAVDDDRMAGGRVGITGTPAFVVNGHIYKGARPKADWNQIIRYEKEAAQKLVDSGVAQAEVYEKLMADAETERGPGVGDSLAQRTKRRRAGEPFPERSYRVATGENRPQLGPDDALVTIVEFADFDCPFCAKVAPTVKSVRAKYGDDVRLVFRQHPLSIHPNAKKAAQAAVAAHKQGKFWEMHDALYADKEAKNKGDFVAMAKKLGLNTVQFEADFDAAETDHWIKLDQAVAMHFGARGTPAFFINGRFLSGAQPPSMFEKIIDEELAKAKAMVEAGTAKSELYAKILEEADPAVLEEGREAKAPPKLEDVAAVPPATEGETDGGADVEGTGTGGETGASEPEPVEGDE